MALLQLTTAVLGNLSGAALGKLSGAIIMQHYNERLESTTVAYALSNIVLDNAGTATC